MRIDDFICLGRTVPEESKKYGVKVCMAGVSAELGSLMRVYPLPIQNPIRARHVCRMELMRNPNDCRRESWKLADHGDSIQEVSSSPVPTGRLLPLIKPYLASSIDELNRARKSLGVIEVRGECLGKFVKRSDTHDPEQLMLFDVADEHLGGRSDIAPYLDFFDQAGKRHELQLREWGCHEWIRKHREQAAQLWDNLRLARQRTWLIVGNMNNHRNVWLVIKTFGVPRVEQLTLSEMWQSGVD